MISKLISKILRHEPFKYNVKIDKRGWVYLDDLVDALQTLLGGNVNVNKEFIIGIIETDQKSRFEYRDNKVRARYGHSIGIDIRYKEAEPLVLFHGTQIDKLESILSKGLVLENVCMFICLQRQKMPVWLQEGEKEYLFTWLSTAPSFANKAIRYTRPRPKSF